jgi:hypothetical protein
MRANNENRPQATQQEQEPMSTDVGVLQTLLREKLTETAKLKEDLKRKTDVLEELLWHTTSKKQKPASNKVKGAVLLIIHLVKQCSSLFRKPNMCKTKRSNLPDKFSGVPEDNRILVQQLAGKVSKHFKTINKPVLKKVPLVKKIFGANGVANFSAGRMAEFLFDAGKMLNYTVVENRTKECKAIKKVLYGKKPGRLSKAGRCFVLLKVHCQNCICRAIGQKRSQHFGPHRG